MISWPDFYFRPINLWSIGVAGSHLTDSEWLELEKAVLSEEEIDDFEESIDHQKTRLGLEIARRVALERIIRMRQIG